MRLIVGLAFSTSLLFGGAGFACAQSAKTSQPASPGYFMPPSNQVAQAEGSGSAVLESHPSGQTSPVIDSNLVDTLPPPSDQGYYTPQPWFETDWGVLGIGVVATGLTMTLDHGINFWVLNHISEQDRTKVALRIANIGELAPLAFAGLTMVQSPISDPELAHASSIAVTAGAAVTAESLGL